MAERRRLLEQDGHVFQNVLIEPVPTLIRPGGQSSKCAGTFGLDRPIADRLGAMLFGSDGGFRVVGATRRGRYDVSLAQDDPEPKERGRHQRDRLGKDGVLPASPYSRGCLPRPGRGAPSPKLDRWWASDRGAMAGMQSRDERREAAVRAMILYPTNALVEDQVSRLRLAVEMRRIRTIPPPEIFFGRYTSSHPGAGRGPELAERVANVKRLAARTPGHGERCATASRIGTDEIRCQFPDPRRGELLTRWDMLVRVLQTSSSQTTR